MNELITIKNVRGYLDENGVAQLNLEDVARGLGILKRDTKDGTTYERINKQALQGWLFGFGILNSEKSNLPDFIPENIFYKLCFKAANEMARAFQNLVTDEILPSIRKHGAYLTPSKIEEVLLNPDTIIQLATTLKQEREKNKRLESDNKALAEGILEWAERSKINHAIRLLASRTGTSFGATWNRLYDELRYKHHIGLRQRGKAPYIQHVEEGEWPLLVQSFSAICEDNGISPTQLMKKAKFIKN